MYIPDHDMIPPEYEPCEKKCRLCGATYAYDDFFNTVTACLP